MQSNSQEGSPPCAVASDFLPSSGCPASDLSQPNHREASNHISQPNEPDFPYGFDGLSYPDYLENPTTFGPVQDQSPPSLLSFDFLNPLQADRTSTAQASVLFPTLVSSDYSAANREPYVSTPEIINPVATRSTPSLGPGLSSSSVSTPGLTKRKQPTNDASDESTLDKRRRNNVAAAKYRQKKVDRIASLEQEVREVSKQRDELKIQLARRDAELEVLRGLVKPH